MKKLFSLIVACVLSCTLVTPAFATEKESTRNVDGVRVSSSITDDQLANLPQVVLERLQEIDATLVSVSTQGYDFEPNSAASVRAVMPEEDFWLSLCVSELSDIEKKQDGIDVTADAYEFYVVGTWECNPFYEFTDCIGIAWSDEFTLYYDEGYTHTPGSVVRYDTMVLNDVNPEQGFAYDVDLKLFDWQECIVLIGRVYKADSSGSANVSASYGHVTLRPSSVNVSYGDGKLGMDVGFAAAIKMAAPAYQAVDY